ncbi:MAG TPA: hypothetical protein VGG72_28860 [Bryobacteraceae bacterium]|jgi:hypothetical protein
MPYGSHHPAAPHRQPYHKPHTSLGAAGHWVREAGILAPLIISEFVKDPGKQWRYIRIASIATALLSEGMWTAKVHRERETAREREAMCHSQG